VRAKSGTSDAGRLVERLATGTGSANVSQQPFRPVRVSAIHEAHVALGATFREDGAWRVPDVYTEPADEAERARAAVGLADRSASGTLQVRGEAAARAVAAAAGGEPMPPGAATRLRLAGADVLACRLAPDEILVLTAPADADRVAGELSTQSRQAGCAHVIDLSGAFTLIDVIGPRTSQLLARLVPLDLDALPPLGVAQAPLGRVPGILVRLDRLTAPGLRVLVPREHGAFVWDLLSHAGQDLGLVAVGAAARARLEGGA
jgi:aminomethyltransferase